MSTNIKQDIIEMIESLRVYVNQDGGDLEFIDFIDGIVHIKVLGACIGCELLDVTYKDGVETILIEEFSEVKGVKLV